MRILAIETSCDETALSIVDVSEHPDLSFTILAHEIASQAKLHEPYGGVYPSLAKREHLKNLPPLFEKISKEHGNADIVAVTAGPGLSPCLWTGIEFAKSLAEQWNVSLVPANHMEGHILASLFSSFQFAPSTKDLREAFPALALTVSGGHTQLISCPSFGTYKLLGETRDDAAGECFDKTARILGLPYPGGPEIAKLAATYAPTKGEKPIFPRPMISTKDYDFSFSGLKTAVLYRHEATEESMRTSKEYLAQTAYEIQEAITDVLCKKTVRAVQEHNAKSVIVGGGVGANLVLLKKLRNSLGECVLRVAPPELCTDNGVMMALAGYASYLRGEHTMDYQSVTADPNASIGQKMI